MTMADSLAAANTAWAAWANANEATNEYAAFLAGWQACEEREREGEPNMTAEEAEAIHEVHMLDKDKALACPLCMARLNRLYNAVIDAPSHPAEDGGTTTHVRTWKDDPCAACVEDDAADCPFVYCPTDEPRR